MDMASKNKKTTKKERVSLLKNERFIVGLGIFFILFSFYLCFAMFSYIFTWQNDNIEWIGIFSGSSVVVENWGGKLGAYLSHTFMHNWFGLSAFYLPFIGIYFGSVLLKRPIVKEKKHVFSGFLITIVVSLILGYIDNRLESVGFLLGGEHGYFLVAWFESFLGQIGTVILLLLITFLLTIVVSNKVFKQVQHWLKPKVKPETIKSDVETTEEVTTDSLENKEDTTELDINFSETEEASLETTLDISGNDAQLLEDKRDGEIEFRVETEMEEDTLSDIMTNIDERGGEEDKDEELEIDVVEMEAEDEADIQTTAYEQLEEYDPRADLSHFKFPSSDILKDHEVNNTKVMQEELNENKDKIVETLRNYKIEITSITATIGPTITLYEIVPAPGIRISKIKNLEDDIALSLSALGIRIIAPMPGKGTVGIEVPNNNPQVVSMRSTIASKVFQESKYQLPIILGKNIYNKTHVIDLAKTPHMLVAGATGQGKSVGINAILTSLLYKKHPAELKLVLIDPKKVELSIYSRIEKHYLAKLPDGEEAVITDVQKVVATLNSLTKEMDTRYDLLKEGNVRNIIEYNSKFINRRLNPEKGHRYLPYIVVVIDEFADLIMTAGKEVEHPIARIAQLARAVGIHLIVATQRPSTNVITGMIKANFPTRVAFRVQQMVDSRTILDSPGANQLIGRGDMLISQGGGEMIRLQCPFVDTPEVDALVEHIQEQQAYPTAFLLPEPDSEALGQSPSDADMQQKDDMFEEAARLMVQTQQGSTSSIQRRFSIGYNRAGRIMDQLEAAGIVGPYEGSKARKVLIPDEYTLEQFLRTLEE